MSIERYIRSIAGSFILISLALAHWVNPNWLWLTAFVGVNLFQAGLTNWVKGSTLHIAHIVFESLEFCL